MKKLFTLLLGLPAIAIGTVSCTDEPGPEPPVAKKHRTVIEYMVADNNLYPYAENNINDMEAAWNDDLDGHMVVYLHPVASGSGEDFDPSPRLLLITRDQTSAIASRVLKTYGRDIDPCDPAVMRQVIADAMALAPAESYALVFWSHGSGWIPKGMGQPLKSAVPAGGLDHAEHAPSKLIGSSVRAEVSDPQWTGNAAVGYSFGQSNSHGNSEMEIDAMAQALPAGTVFDFILFDACHMACIETAWELKDQTHYLIASAAETLAAGFPYRKIIAPMFEPQADVEAIGREFFDYYDTQTGAWRSATVGVVRCDRLPELAASVKALCQAGLPEAGISYAGQQYGRSAMGFDRTFYDLEDFVRQTWGMYEPAGVSAFETALQEVVVYAAATPWLFDEIRVNTHCGLSCYLPRSSTPLSLEAYRTRFGWSAASGMGALVP
ncbi:clostripain-related cysteine peptidase [uncultured Rikenella sp.]|uniref:clostripain-related cysteine peptidase n=1 Tax=uncultured Rikenella sp. TaxID=368003 RepID=UPI002624D45C|nr:clostripain-related cysteine peptidase [uncultured Rikenella sp.]